MESFDRVLMATRWPCSHGMRACTCVVRRSLCLPDALRERSRCYSPPSQRILSKNGLERYDPMGQRFDPNTMNAMFENPDPSVSTRGRGNCGAVSA